MFAVIALSSIMSEDKEELYVQLVESFLGDTDL